MSKWSNLQLTKLGLALQAKVEAGAVLEFTRMATGDGTPMDIESMTELAREKQALAIQYVGKTTDDLTKIGSMLTNEDLKVGYTVRELGLFANDPQQGEILYAVTVDSKPDFLPTKTDDVIVSQEMILYVSAGQAQVTAIIDNEAHITAEYLENELHIHDISRVAHYDFIGATTSANGKRGFVPAPNINERESFLKADGTWARISSISVPEINSILEG